MTNYIKGDRVYVQVASKHDPQDLSLPMERTEIPATVEGMMFDRDGKKLPEPLVIVTVDAGYERNRQGRRDGYGFGLWAVRQLAGDPKTINVWRERVRELEDAIRKHRAARGHDRCWENDLELYALLRDGVDAAPELPPHDEFIAHCEEYYECQRQHRDGKPS